MNKPMTAAGNGGQILIGVVLLMVVLLIFIPALVRWNMPAR